MTSKINRRDFLKQTALAAAMPTIISSTALGADDIPAPSQRVNLGFIDSAGLADPHGLLRGHGASGRHVRFAADDSVARPGLEELIRQASQRAM